MPQTLNVGARSVFVTTVGWVFILLATMAVAWALVRFASAGSVLAALPVPQGLTALLAAYLPWVMAAGLALSLGTLAAAIGLLLRLDWARRVVIGLLLVAIVANLGGLWLQHELLESVVSQTLLSSPLPTPAIDVLGGFVTASRVLATVLTLGTCAILAWVIQRLRSWAVRQEFA